MSCLPLAINILPGDIPPVCSRRHIRWVHPLLKNSVHPPMARRGRRRRQERLARSVRVNVPNRIVRPNAHSANVETSAFHIFFLFLSHYILIWTYFCNETGRHVKALESRSQLLDAALASADEANRRWEECRALVDQLRIENAALRAALSQSQMMGSGVPTVAPPNGGEERPSAAPGTDSKSAEEPKE